MALYLLTIVSVLLLAPLLTGSIKSFKMWLLFRRPVKPWQPYADFSKLLHKEVVLSREASWLTQWSPYLVLSPIVVAVLMLPPVNAQAWFMDWSDAFTLTGLMALSAFFLMLLGLDQASGFGGMGASREAFISALVEPVMILTMFSVSLLAGHLDLGRAAQVLGSDFPWTQGASFLFAAVAFFMLLLAENGRIPIDNPETHLELTMVHEAMILDLSGWQLALIESASSLKFALFAALFATLFLPFGYSLSWPLALLVFWLKLFLVAMGVALIEVSTAKLRLFKVPNLLAVAVLLSFLSLILFYMAGGIS